jgi:outer membrane biosynthesis protein TonB
MPYTGSFEKPFNSGCGVCRPSTEYDTVTRQSGGKRTKQSSRKTQRGAGAYEVDGPVPSISGSQGGQGQQMGKANYTSLYQTTGGAKRSRPRKTQRGGGEQGEEAQPAPLVTGFDRGDPNAGLVGGKKKKRTKTPTRKPAKKVVKKPVKKVVKKPAKKVVKKPAKKVVKKTTKKVVKKPAKKVVKKTTKKVVKKPAKKVVKKTTKKVVKKPTKKVVKKTKSVVGKVVSKASNLIKRGTKTVKHTLGLKGGFYGSDFANTAGSRGNASAPTDGWQNGEKLFRTFNKSGQFIRNEDLKYAAAPISTGRDKNRFGIPGYSSSLTNYGQMN